MEKVIKMSEDTWMKLTHYKYELGARSLDEVIQALMKICSEVKLANQIKLVKRNANK